MVYSRNISAFHSVTGIYFPEGARYGHPNEESIENGQKRAFKNFDGTVIDYRAIISENLSTKRIPRIISYRI
jgi:hypothetical protein